MPFSHLNFQKDTSTKCLNIKISEYCACVCAITRFEQNISDMAFFSIFDCWRRSIRPCLCSNKKNRLTCRYSKNWVKKYGQSETKLSEESDNSQDSSVIQRKTRVLCIVQKNIINAKSKIKKKWIESNERSILSVSVHIVFVILNVCASVQKVQYCSCTSLSFRKSVDGTLQSKAMKLKRVCSSATEWVVAVIKGILYSIECTVKAPPFWKH